jgi:hypothetical protein
MTQPTPPRRLADNEAVFRRYNEQMQARMDSVRRGNAPHFGDRAPSAAVELPFYCECADENCRKRISMTAADYRAAHAQRDMFVLLPGHETMRIERTLRKMPGYYIVEKFVKPSETATTLHKTDLHNV